MNDIDKDIEYMLICEDIYNNKQFNKLKQIEHHGTTRYAHSVRVSYISYKVTKLLKLNYIETARAGLLHDFFLSEPDRTLKQKFISTFNHSKKSLENSINEFSITGKEMDIIRSHMFPIDFVIPKYVESWVVSFVDKLVAIYEFSLKLEHKMSYVTSLSFVFLLNYFK